MKKVLFGLMIASIGLFSSCDKCKDKDCKNGASCDKKTGECADVCENGGTSSTDDGSCSCTTYYKGDKCEAQVRSDYYGTYLGTATTGSGETSPMAITVEARGTNVQHLQTQIPIRKRSNDVVVTETFEASLTSATTVELVERSFDESYFGLPASVKGTGTISKSKLDATLEITLTLPTGGTLIEKATFTGAK
jgi:hypothetical protein